MSGIADISKFASYVLGLRPVHMVISLSIGIAIVAMIGIGAHLSSQRLYELQTAESAVGSLAKQQAHLISGYLERVEVVLSQLESQLNILRTFGSDRFTNEHDLLRRYMDLLPGSVDILLYESDRKTLVATASQPGSTLLVDYCRSLLLQLKDIQSRGVFAFREGTAARCPPAGTLIYVRPLNVGERSLWLLISPEAFQAILLGDLPALAKTARFRILSGDRAVLAESAVSSEQVPGAKFPKEFSDRSNLDGLQIVQWNDFASGTLMAAVSAPVKGTSKQVQIFYLPDEFLARSWWPEVRFWLWLSGGFSLIWIILSVLLVLVLNEYQRKLLASEQRFENSLDYADIGAWDWNIETGDLHWSRRIAPLFGYLEGQLTTSYANFLQAVHPEDRAAVESAVATSLEKGTPYQIEHRVIWPDGTERWVEERGNVLRSATGSNLRMLGVVMDITASRSMRHELMVYQDQLEYQVRQRSGELAEARDTMEAASYARTAFLANVGHELRAPINALRHGVRQAMNLIDNPKATEYLREADAKSQQILNMINDILDLSALEVNHVVMARVTFSLDQLNEELARTFHEVATGKGIGLSFILAPELAKLPLLGDLMRLRQVLNNLVDNAFKHTESGSIKISIDVLETTDMDLMLGFRVTDTGDGIPQALLVQITAMLGSPDVILTLPTVSRGLGLILCKRLVHLMGGQIGCESDEGRGSSFWFNVRLKTAAVFSPGSSGALASGAPNEPN